LHGVCFRDFCVQGPAGAPLKGALESVSTPTIMLQLHPSSSRRRLKPLKRNPAILPVREARFLPDRDRRSIRRRVSSVIFAVAQQHMDELALGPRNQFPASVPCPRPRRHARRDSSESRQTGPSEFRAGRATASRLSSDNSRSSVHGRRATFSAASSASRRAGDFPPRVSATISLRPSLATPSPSYHRRPATTRCPTSVIRMMLKVMNRIRSAVGKTLSSRSPSA